MYLGIMLVIAIAALTGGNPDTGNMLLLIFGMMAGPFVFNGWVVVAMLARVKVSRHLAYLRRRGLERARNLAAERTRCNDNFRRISAKSCG